MHVLKHKKTVNEFSEAFKKIASSLTTEELSYLVWNYGNRRYRSGYNDAVQQMILNESEPIGGIQ